MTNINVDYEKALNNHMRSNVVDAVQHFIQGEKGFSMVIFPQALNPFLKSLESMGVWNTAIVLPYHDDKNKPLYLVLKVGECTVSKISIVEVE